MYKTPKWHNRYAKLHEWFDIHFRKKHYIKTMERNEFMDIIFKEGNVVTRYERR